MRDDHTSLDIVSNAAFRVRKAWTADGVSKRFFGKLNCSMFQQERLLVPGVDFLLRLERAKDAFAIFNANPLSNPRWSFRKPLYTC